MKFTQYEKTLKELLLSLDIVVDNEYLDEYVNLIAANLTTANIKGKTQKHHPIPVSAYEATEDATARSRANRDIKNKKVNLNYSDHIHAHKLLVCCGKQLKFIMANASAASIMYNALLPAIENNIVAQLETEAEISKAYEYLVACRAAAALARYTEKQNSKGAFDLTEFNRNRVAGKVAVHNDTEFIYVTPEEATTLILSGNWKPGTKKTITYCSISKNNKYKNIYSKDLISYLQKGWQYASASITKGIPIDGSTGTNAKKVRYIETDTIYNSLSEAEIALNLPKSTISGILRGTRNPIPGMTFEYCTNS